MDERDQIELPEGTEWRVSLGQLKVFPDDVIEPMALELARSLDCHVPTKECEAAAVGFVRALIAHGWLICPPSLAPRS